MYELIEQLKNRQLLWQGTETRQDRFTASTGLEELDSRLDGGFPLFGVVELQSRSGIGELRLLLSHIRQNQKALLRNSVIKRNCLDLSDSYTTY